MSHEVDEQVRDRLNRARQDLLDLTTRTRLLNTPRGPRPKTVEVVDELSEEVFKILVRSGKKMSFLPAPEESNSNSAAESQSGPDWLAQPDATDTGPAARHTDTRLQTKMSSVKLQRRLLQMYYDARSFEQEQGVNILFLALGFLRWFDSPTSDRVRYAPLILVPVTLERTSAQRPFKISYSGEDLNTNLSLQAKLKADFGMDLPDLDDVTDDSESGDPVEHYLQQVRSAVAGHPRWAVCPNDLVLGFLSFAKFLMYRDLDPDNWPKNAPIDGHPLLNGLLGNGVEHSENPFSDGARIDDLLDPAKTFHVLDADSSQALAIEDIRRGGNLVVQGPPGTGKSQTIANVIATAVADGKSVLFVAEKMAALDVVKRRLDEIGLGPMCLELHSHKANKKSVLEQVWKTLELGKPRVDGAKRIVRDLRESRAQLDAHARRIHSPLPESGYSAYQISGHLVRLANARCHPQEFSIPDGRTWNPDDLAAAKSQIDRMARHLELIGTPAEHPWRGVGLTAPLPQDVKRILSNTADVAERLRNWVGEVRELSDELGVEVRAFQDVEHLISLSRALLAAPNMDSTAASDAVWIEQLPAIRDLIATGERLAEIESEIDPLFTADGWDQDLSDERRHIRAHGESLFRILKREYRDSVTKLKGLTKRELPKPAAEKVRLLDLLSEGQSARNSLGSVETLAASAFGSFWDGRASDWKHLGRIADWIESTSSELAENVPEVLARAANPDHLSAAVEAVDAAKVGVVDSLDGLLGSLQLDLAKAWGVDSPAQLTLDDVQLRLTEWLQNPEGVSGWVTFRIWNEELHEAKLGPVAEMLADGRLRPDRAVGQFEATYFGDLMRQVFELHPELITFQGQDHEAIISKFREVDLERIELARRQVAAAHHESIPRGAGAAGEMGVLRGEFNRRRGHLPLRRLFSRAGNAIQAIKPVFMMSPMSIAQYLEPGGVDFDLVVMDEASQIRPIEALGAVARGRQVIVVGDDKQLPPTRFFDKIASDEDREEEEAQAGDLESILGLCTAKGYRSRMLEWHYRSRHQSLIAVSNREFYDDRLFIIPSAGSEEDLGLRYNHVDGTYDRGGTSSNQKEARAVAEAVMAHARERPDLTLGVGTFSVAQRDAVLDQLELLRRENQDTEQFFSDKGPEPFFVKNLESVQGDERDIVFISVGYGRDAHGYFAMNFGPLNSDGGERRLNVLITRARRRLEVFSSISWSDIDLNRARGRGVAALKVFLKYAELGDLGIAQATDRPTESPFEREVGRELEQVGHDVEYQVGVAGFFIDIAIRDPKRPGRFILGVECDGATYHSARSTRDRDRLRQQVLEDRGWTIHRVWSTDWFQTPDRERQRLWEAIEKVRGLVPAEPLEPEDVDPQLQLPSRGGDPDPDPVIPREPSVDVEPASSPTEAEPYQEATFRHSSRREPHEAPVRELLDVIMRIVNEEEPIHIEELARRIASVWGLSRAGRRIRAATEQAVSTGVRREDVRRIGDFVYRYAQKELQPRSRRNVSSQTLRAADMIPPAEVNAGLREIVKDHLAVNPDDAATLLSRLLGFDRLGSDLKAAFQKGIRMMLRDEELVLDKDGNLNLPRGA